MVLHLHSIWLIGALTAFVYGLLMLVVRPAKPDYLAQTMRSTGASGLALGMAFLLRSDLTGIPWAISLSLANTLVPLGLAFGYQAISRLKRMPSSRMWLVIPPAASLGCTLWFSFVQRNITICQLLYNTENVVLLVAILALLHRGNPAQKPRADLLAQITFLLLAGSTLVVVLLFVASGNYPVEYDFDQPRAVYSVVVTITFASLIYFILVLMIFERVTQELSIQALRDPLTGVYNRRAFEELAFRELSGARRSGAPLALIVCDIDRFKQVNDNYGHLVGDQVLQQVAHLLRASLRDEDTLCRWGGDEFVALLPRAGVEEAQRVAERVGHVFAQGSLQAEGVAVPVRVSLGVAAGEKLHDDLSTLLQEADRAMYHAKRTQGEGSAEQSVA